MKKQNLLSLFHFFKGLGLEGWYITKNLLVEISLLGFGYISGVKGVQVFITLFLIALFQKKNLPPVEDINSFEVDPLDFQSIL